MTLKWDEMSPRERDALVADCVMNCPYVTDSSLPHYTTDISAAWEVLSKFNGWQITELTGTIADMHPEKYRVFVEKNKNVAFANTAPEAICLAALGASGVDV